MSSSLSASSQSAPLSPSSSAGIDYSSCFFYDQQQEVPSPPRPDYSRRSCIQFEEGQLQSMHAPLLPMLSDEEDEMAEQTHDEAVLLRPRPSLSSSIFRDNLSSSIGISMASSVCSSSDECPSLAASLEDSSYGDDELSEVEESSDCFFEKSHYNNKLNLVYLQPEHDVQQQQDSDVFSLRPRTSSVYDFEEFTYMAR